MDKLELAERCEKATGEDLELDLAIGDAVGTWPAKPNTFKFPRRYSRSLDAAMTLVPEGLIWAVTNCGAEDRLIPDMSVASAVVGKADDPSKPSVAATPALALCAAALRAREGGKS
jgi:hypothetical protein